MGIEVTGTIHTIFDVNRVSDRFTKREFVLELEDSKYPQHVLFQATGDRCAMLDDLGVGDKVRVEFSLRGREWRSPKGEIKYFNSLDVWKIDRLAAAQRGGSSGGSSAPHGGANDDIPFATCDLVFEPSPIAATFRRSV